MSIESNGYVPPEAKIESKDKLLDSKYFQAMNKLYQIEARGESVADALAKDPELKSTVDEVLKDLRWNPTHQTIDQLSFSQEDAEKTFKMGNKQTSWQKDNPIYRAWQHDVPNADEIIDELLRGEESDFSEGSANRTSRHQTEIGGSTIINTQAELPGRKMDQSFGEQLRETQAKADQAAVIEAARYEAVNKAASEEFFAETPDQNLSEGGTQEGFGRPTRRETTSPFSTVSREVGMAGGKMSGELGEKMRATQAEEDKKQKGAVAWFKKLFGRGEETELDSDTKKAA